jgi:hypothetical protein
MPDHIANRDRIIAALREEMVGPSPQGEELDCGKEIVFTDVEDTRKPWKQKGTGDEILQRDAPLNRYGVGILFPFGEAEDEEVPAEAIPSPVAAEELPAALPAPDGEVLSEGAMKRLEEIEGRAVRTEDPSDFDLSVANKFLPGSMGVSFLAEFPEGSELVVEASGGRYTTRKVRYPEGERTWWFRSPVKLRAKFDGVAVRSKQKLTTKEDGEVEPENIEGLDLRVEVYSRPRREDGRRLVTVCLINRTLNKGARDGSSLFQSLFKVSVVSSSGAHHILPYPESDFYRMDEEEESLALLYRNTQTYAVGHGCAADWGGQSADNKVGWVSAECFPAFETPSITPDIRREDGSPIEVQMARLAGLDPQGDGMGELSDLVGEYERWIDIRRTEIPQLNRKYRGAAESHIDECARCAERMREGLEYLRANADARLAFRLANHAVLLQQLRSRREPRHVQYDAKQHRLVFSEPYLKPDATSVEGGRGKWRAFQIAFLLMTLRSTAEHGVPERRTVELIWFPTGGGKTEAYLGLTAFALFMRRLQKRDDSGVHVLMRYTLRLLTAQQFQRAAGLICAMDYLRRGMSDRLGGDEFSIGLWLGSATTPNKREDALSILRGLQSPRKGHTENSFIVGRCPWCAAQMGPLEHKGRAPRNAPNVVGYEQRGTTVIFKCPDIACEFSSGLPVYVIDEDIYDRRPSLVIGTVDKFAMLAWKPEARALFGIEEDGRRISSPPGLIIQDELHLISGPLGSVVGLYETLIEELCTDRRGDEPVPPKIVSSTATIRRYREQILALYAREDAALFPPPGLEAADSFFARYARTPDGAPARGRVYVGVNAPGLGSLQNTEVRTYTALLQAPMQFTPEEQDPWWTLLIFFNNLRMLGNSLSLFQSNVPDYFKIMFNRTRNKNVRRLNDVRELTGRLRSDEVPNAIAALEVSRTSGSGKAVDVCLASNIIEVGVDIDRLSLMAVVGQPKTTSQYIQVTGRVGRRWWERPGVVVSLYSAAKPRDRSHFEKFRSYHERLYAQVEPTSVTPFSPPALDRALHAVMAAYVRQAGDEEKARKPYPFPEDMIERLREIMLPRIRAVDPGEEENFERVFTKRAEEWKRWERTLWENSFGAQQGGETPLLRPAGAYVSRENSNISWATQQSMRNVDAEGQIEITQLYLTEGEVANA